MRQLNSVDAMMLALETSSHPNHVAAISIYDPSTAPGGEITIERILDYITPRLRLAPPFRQKLVRVPLHLDEPYWVEDIDFDLEYHVRELALPRPGTWRQLSAQLGQLHSRPLDLSRPPWELYVIGGLDSLEGVPEGSFATMLKLHHSAVDGLAGNELLTALHDHSPDAPPPPGRDEWRPEPPPSVLGMLARAAVGGVLLPLRVGGIAASSLPGLVAHHLPFRRRNDGEDMIDEDLKTPGMLVPRTRFSGLVSPHRVTELRSWPQDELRQIKAQVPGATVNDTSLAIVGGAMRLYLQEKKELPEQSLTTMVPVSTRSASEASAGGNSISFVRIPLHTDIADPIERLEAINRMTRHAKVVTKGVPAQVLNRISDELPGMLLGVGQRASAQIAYRLGQAILANTTVTNVPGPREVLYFCGARMVAQYGMGPLANGLGLLHIFSSYAGTFMLSITADRAMMPDPAFYGECLDESYAGLAKGRARTDGATLPGSPKARSTSA